MKQGERPGDGGEQTETKILLSSISAMIAETTTFPIDLTKTRLQLHGESDSLARPTNALRVASEIVRHQGPLSLYKGLSPAIIRHLLYTPIRIVGYENLRNLLVGDNITGGSFSLPTKALVGGISGAIAQVLSISFFFFFWVYQLNLYYAFNFKLILICFSMNYSSLSHKLFYCVNVVSFRDI